MDTIFVKPKSADILVPNPDKKMKPISTDGETVPHNRYWKRRIKDGDVTIAKPASPTKAEAKK